MYYAWSSFSARWKVEKNCPNKNKKSQSENVIKYVPCITGTEYDYDYAPPMWKYVSGEKIRKQAREQREHKTYHNRTIASNRAQLVETNNGVTVTLSSE